MKRIAKIKINSNTHLYNYILEDNKIKIGDVVYVQDHQRPHYVYDIVDFSSKEYIPTKKVLRKATENPNVTLASRYMNIINCKYTCIVNSLGPWTSVFGDICDAIVTNALSKGIFDMLKKHPTANIFDTFITDAGQLPSKHIIHIVMPFKDDDHDNSKLRWAFEKVIDLAIENGYDKLGIPHIGTGANGYSKKDIQEALNDTMFKYQYKEGIKIDIVSISYNPGYNEAECEVLGFPEFEGKDKYENLDFTPYEDNFKQISIINKLISRHYIESDEFKFHNNLNPDEYNVGYFIDDYRYDVGYEETKEIIMAFGRVENDESKTMTSTVYSSMIKNLRRGRKIKQVELYRMAKGLHMNFTRIIQFMNLCGFSFSPISENNIDYEILYYIIHNDGFIKPTDEIDAYFMEECPIEIQEMLGIIDEE